SCTQYLIQCVQFLLLFWWCTQYKIQCVQFLLHFWWCTQYKIQCSHYTVSNTVQVVYTVSNTVCTVSTTFLVVYTVSNTVCTVSTTLQVVYTVTNTVCTVSNILQAVYTVSNTVCTVSTTFLVVRCTQYLIQCSVVLQNKKYIMSKGPPRRGRHSQATKRGQAASVSTANSGGHGHVAFSAGGRGAPLSFFFLLLAVLLSHNMSPRL
ncbi:hypothetical protein AB205_0146840, partial [Aquarana catesbeiana]